MKINDKSFQEQTKIIFKEETKLGIINLFGRNEPVNFEKKIKFWLNVYNQNFDSNDGENMPLWMKRSLKKRPKTELSRWLDKLRLRRPITEKPISDYALNEIDLLVDRVAFDVWGRTTEAPKKHEPIGRAIVFPSLVKTFTFRVRKFVSISNFISVVEQNFKNLIRGEVLLDTYIDDLKNFDSTLWVLPPVRNKKERDRLFGHIRRVVFHFPDNPIYICIQKSSNLNYGDFIKANLSWKNVIIIIALFPTKLLLDKTAITINCEKGLIFSGNLISPRVGIYSNSLLVSVMHLARSILASECYLDEASIARGYRAISILLRSENAIVSFLLPSPQALILNFILTVRKKFVMKPITLKYEHNLSEAITLKHSDILFCRNNSLYALEWYNNDDYGGTLFLILLRRILHGLQQNSIKSSSCGHIDFLAHGGVSIGFSGKITQRGDFQFHLPTRYLENRSSLEQRVKRDRFPNAKSYQSKLRAMQVRAQKEMRIWNSQRAQLFKELQKLETVNLFIDLQYFSCYKMTVYYQNRRLPRQEIFKLIFELL